MIKLDLSRAVPARALRPLIALVPGCFFLICMALGNTAIVAQFIAQLRFALPLGDFAIAVVALFLAYIIGAASVNLVFFIQYVFIVLYKPYFLFRTWFRERVLLPFLNRLVSTQPPQPNAPPPTPKLKPRWLLNFRSRTIQRVYSPVPYDRARFEWWQALAEQLLRTKYGMEDANFPTASRQPLFDVLTTPTAQEQRGNLLMVALHATGWLALVASYFVPDLRVRWFYLFTFFLIGTGVHHDLYVASYRMNPLRGPAIQIRALLREFPKNKLHQR